MSGRGAIGSALALGARGCQFESGRPDQIQFLFFIKSSNQAKISKIFILYREYCKEEPLDFRSKHITIRIRRFFNRKIMDGNDP